MPVDQSEILKEAVELLRADATLITLLGETAPSSGEARVYNHAPQDEDLPYLAINWQADTDWDTKDSLGFDGSLVHEAVSPHHGDRDVLQVIDAVRLAYAGGLTLVSGKVVCLNYATGSVQVQVLETHRATAVFSVLVDEDL